MNHIVKFATTLVALGLLALTFKGAYSLTHSPAMTVVLGSLVVIQWAAARNAMDALRSAAMVGRLHKAAGFSLLWLATATVTVSFAGSELYLLLSATNAADKRFDLERGHLLDRAQELERAFTTVTTVSEQYAKHASVMADLEEAKGGSCRFNRGSGPGEIRDFRRMDRHAASALSGQIKPEADAARAQLRRLTDLRLTEVSELRRSMSNAASSINGLAKAPIWPQLIAFVEAQRVAARIKIGNAEMICEDTARDLSLAQLDRTAKATLALVALPAPQLLDPTDSRDMAIATVVRTWASVLALLPDGLLKGRALIDPSMRARYNLTDSGAVLSTDTLPLALAWVLEFCMLALIWLAERSPKGGGEPVAAVRIVMGYLARREGFIGQIARDLQSPVPQPPRRPPYVDCRALFADEAMQERATTVAPYYRPWGGRDLIAVPFSNFIAVRAARELWRAGLVKRLASAVPSAELMRDRRLAGVMNALGGAEVGTVYDLFDVVDDHFARWLLAEPVEARKTCLEAAE